MQTLLNITLEENGSLLVSSDLFNIEPYDTQALLLKAIRPLRLEDQPCSHPLLKEKLILWRREKARELNLSAFIILNNRTLLAIADAAPLSAEELLSVRGFGPILYERYGAEILQLADHCLTQESESHEKVS